MGQAAMRGSFAGFDVDQRQCKFGHAFDLHVAVLEQPLVVLFEEDSADQPGDAGLVWEDADDIGPSLDLLVETLQRVGRMRLGAVLRREGYVGENVVLAVVHQHAELGPARPELVGDVAPGVMRGRGIAERPGGSRQQPSCADPSGHAPGRCASNAPDTFARWRRAYGRWHDAGRRARPRSPA
jgi:hypothetical protein